MSYLEWPELQMSICDYMLHITCLERVVHREAYYAQLITNRVVHSLPSRITGYT